MRVVLILSLFITTATAIAAPQYGTGKHYLHWNHNRGASRVIKAGTDAVVSASNGDFNMVVVVAQYSDVKLNSNSSNLDVDTSSTAYWDDLFFGTTTADGPYPFPSLSQYYSDQSRQKMLIKGEVAPVLTLNLTAQEYAEYDSNTPNTGCFGLADQFQGKLGSNPQRGGATVIVQEALLHLLDNGYNLDDYISNDDGVIDGVVVIHAGPGGENTSASDQAEQLCPSDAGSSDIWSHVLERPYKINGESYSTRILVAAEQFYDPFAYRKVPAGLGVIAHEFGHVLGLNDYYDISQQGFGIGQYSIMAYGLYDQGEPDPKGVFGPDVRPKSYDPYLKSELGWNTLKHVNKDQCFTQMYSTAETENIHQLVVLTELFGDPRIDSEYYILEHRPRTNWDADLRGKGLLLWHIDENIEIQNLNCVPSPADSCEDNHYQISLVQADGLYDLENHINTADDGDSFTTGAVIKSQTLARSSSQTDYDLSLYDDTPLPYVIEVVNGVTAEINLLAGPEEFDNPDLIEGRIIGGTPDTVLAVGQEFSFTPIVRGNFGEIRWQLLDYPTGMSIAADGTITWEAAEPGDYVVTIQAHSCSTEKDIRTFTIEVPESEGGCTATAQPGSARTWLPMILLLIISQVVARGGVRRAKT